MSALAGVLPGRRSSIDDGAPSVRPPVARRDRRTLLLVASVAVVGASIAAFSALYASADHKVPAVVVVRPVAQGQPLTSADLGEVQVAVSPGVAFLPLDQVAVVSGKRAAVALAAGTLLTAADLTGAPAVAAGDAVVGVALKDGTFPSGGLAPGDRVLVVQTAAPGSSIASPTAAGAPGAVSIGPAGTGVPGVSFSGSGSGSGSAAGAVGTGTLVPQASVFAVTAPAASSSAGIALLVSLDVPASVAAQVATAAAAGQVGLVLLPRAGAPTTATTAVGP